MAKRSDTNCDSGHVVDPAEGYARKKRYKSMEPPIWWLGGKRIIAPTVWCALGDPDRYIEPFAGSLAVLFARPAEHASDKFRVEIINDSDSLLVNYWRAMERDAEAVVRIARRPPMEQEIVAARRYVLYEEKSWLSDKIKKNIHFCDIEIAGLWLYAHHYWFGSNITCYDKLLTKKPSIKMPPQLETAIAVKERISGAFICCGDWSRVVSDSYLPEKKTIGIYFDPPYSNTYRFNKKINYYRHDDRNTPADVAAWCAANGERKNIRIVLSGLDGEHDMPKSWRKIKWKSAGAMSKIYKGVGRANKHREVLWLSPHCLPVETEGLLWSGDNGRNGD